MDKFIIELVADIIKAYDKSISDNEIEELYTLAHVLRNRLDSLKNKLEENDSYSDKELVEYILSATYELNRLCYKFSQI
jgi:hypothetical protein